VFVTSARSFDCPAVGSDGRLLCALPTATSQQRPLARGESRGVVRLRRRVRLCWVDYAVSSAVVATSLVVTVSMVFTDSSER